MGRGADARSAGSGRTSRLARVRGVEGVPGVGAGRRPPRVLRRTRRHRWRLGVRRARRARRRGGRARGRGDGVPAPRPRPIGPAVLVSRHGGAPAWSPDGKRLAIANLPPPDPGYNGNPERNTDEPPPLFSGGDALPPVARRRAAAGRFRRARDHDAGARDNQLLAPSIACGRRCGASTTRPGRPPRRGRSSRAKYRPQAHAAQDEPALEAVIDAMVAEQPLIKPLVSLRPRRVVVSGHPLASRAGALVLERGGNIVDAAIAVSFALGVVEPDASGIGGDGMAVLYLKGMTEPIAIDYKDQVPIRATRDNPLLDGRHRRWRDRPRTSRASWPASICSIAATPARGFRGATSSRRRSSMPRTATSSMRRCRRRLPRAGGSSRSTERRRASTCPTATCRRPAIASSTATTRPRCRTIAKDGADASIAARSPAG